MMLANHRFQQMPQSAADVVEMTRAAVKEQPVAVVLAAFGAGLGVGVGVGLLLSETECLQSRQQPAMMDHVVETVSRLLPDAIARHFSR